MIHRANRHQSMAAMPSVWPAYKIVVFTRVLYSHLPQLYPRILQLIKVLMAMYYRRKRIKACPP